MWQALQQAMVQLRAASPVFAVAAVLTYAIGVLIASLRWQRILRGIGADMDQHGADQVFGTLANHQADGLFANGRQRQVGQHEVQRGVEIADGVDHGAVQVDDGGVKGFEVGEHVT